ncbi:MAG TPA: LuxR C-terminal-related transcriptional regulator [Nitriliruptorales bacterium]|nr:LuxR C-terminal-related transcriptional regulator [Nitriliruptorales bacterium]
MRIVLCHRHTLFVEALAVALTERDHQVCARVADPAAAPDAVRRHRADGLLLGATLLDAAALQAIARARAAAPRLRIVALGTAADPRSAHDALEAGADAVASQADDLTRILQLLEGRPGMRRTPAVTHRAATAGPLRGPSRRGPTMLSAGSLTEREREILALLVDGQNTAAIARRLGIAYSTARTHIQNLLIKLGAHSKVEAVAVSHHYNLVEFPPSPRLSSGTPRRAGNGGVSALPSAGNGSQRSRAG